MEFLVEYHDVFAKHRFDVGYNKELNYKLTSEHPIPVCVQSSPGPIQLHDELLIEYSLPQNFNIKQRCHIPNTVVRCFFHCKSCGKLEIVFDLRRVNHLLRHDFSNSNIPIRKTMDALNNFPGKSLFCKLGCS